MTVGTQGSATVSKARAGAPGSVLLRAIAVAALVAAPCAHAQTYSVLYSFQCGTTDGSYPESVLTRDAAGDLYGSTSGGGSYEDGTVFELTPGGTETVLHSFAGPPTDGLGPANTSLLFDSAGNIYGVTPFGGTYNYGMAYELSAAGTETVLYNFISRSGNGVYPYGGLVQDDAGNFYGTNFEGGATHQGAVFKLGPSGAESLLYSFRPRFDGNDGELPMAGLIRDPAGNFYGTTEKGGNHDVGTVFELSASGREKVLHSFGGDPDGATPFVGVVRGPTGNLYGTTGFGGNSNEGTVFVVSAAGKARVLHSFTGPPDGAEPYGVLVLDQSGNLYGTTLYGGQGTCSQSFHVGCGTIFEVTPAGTESVLYSFMGTATDGQYPLSGLTLDSAGNLYGATTEGGTYGCGTVFKYTP